MPIATLSSGLSASVPIKEHGIWLIAHFREQLVIVCQQNSESTKDVCSCTVSTEVLARWDLTELEILSLWTYAMHHPAEKHQSVFTSLPVKAGKHCSSSNIQTQRSECTFACFYTAGARTRSTVRLRRLYLLRKYANGAVASTAIQNSTGKAKQNKN